jgi:hypothetical protein
MFTMQDECFIFIEYFLTCATLIVRTYSAFINILLVVLSDYIVVRISDFNDNDSDSTYII